MKKLALLLPIIFVALTAMYRPLGISETIGIVEDINHHQFHIIGEALTPCGGEDILIHIGDAPIYDLTTGLPAPFSHIHVGMSIRVAYETHTNTALVAWLNCDEMDAAVFTVVVSDNIQYYQDSCVFLSADGKYRVTLSLDTVIIDPYYGEITPHDIEPGQEFFVWVDMITASAPSQVYPDKVVLIND